MSIKTDCFAYSNKTESGCNALKRLYCKEEKCKFYKIHREEKAAPFPVFAAKN